MDDVQALAQQAADRIGVLTGVDKHDVALVLGSGWGAAAEALGTPRLEVASEELPGFIASGVPGHGGRVASVSVGGLEVLLFSGRTHLYEGHGPASVAHPVRVAAAAGCRTVVLTNGCGGLRPEWSPGTPVIIRDHINLTAQTPLVGATFVDLTEVYSPRLRALVKEVDPTLDEGVYVQFTGPQYETPAEIRMASVIGGDLVGMSTTLEAIAARAAGLEVLGLSLVTNQAAGMSGDTLDHGEVLDAGRAAGERLGSLLSRVVPRL
ncbi:purine-nucleoside phosphorylase [Nocardioides cavernaquae]|uniref:Purine nucleoside phosphorylase n=1 Tax=Nocardioides cavernaquae TaxID=2321396 RepID=A0A3A5HEY1_9ACTN|nr:purine-nucleoside phosphorylase [Nocardioides cavernaquae]RJS46550.1 purine-nucleoside phosphorylase [Nocardioides cavernaquae]